MMRAPLALFLAISLSRLLQTVSFSSPSLASARKCVAKHVLFAKKKKKKSGATAGVKGFGTSSKKEDGVTMDRSKDTLNFYDYMEKNGAGDNLKKCALGYFTLPSGFQLRGIVALRDIKKGDVIIRIPYEMAINLGPEGEDPTLPGLELLKDYCETHSDGDGERAPYFKLLPPFMGDDCLGSTDFFSNEALDMLQAPLIVEETISRREGTKSRFDEAAANLPPWTNGTNMTEQQLRWAVWLITSRVLTVQGDPDEGRSYRLLIPFLDMCNHDRASPHILTGRAMPGGELKVVAGENVASGDQINICYGGGVAGNDRFIQDYGFLDRNVAAFDIVAQQLLGKRRVTEGASAGKNIALADMERTLERLRETHMEQDAQLLETTTDEQIRSAIEYRLGLKRALSKYMIMA
jgi:hypothetical protein